MPDADDEHDEVPVLDAVDDAVVADAHAQEALAPGERLDAGRPRVRPEGLDPPRPRRRTGGSNAVRARAAAGVKVIA
jgi:hypothetical protein